MELGQAVTLAMALAGQSTDINLAKHAEINVKVGEASANIAVTPFASEKVGVKINGAPTIMIPRADGRGYDKIGGDMTFKK